MKKNKKIISIILTSFMIISIVATSLVPTISSYAQTGGGLKDYFDITEDDFLYQGSSYIDDSIASIFSSNETFVKTFNNNSYIFPSSYDYEVSDNYIIFYNNGTGRYSYGFVPDGSFINVIGNNAYLFFEGDSDYSLASNHRLWEEYSVDSQQSNGTKTIDGVEYRYRIYTCSTSFYFLSTNCPIYNLPSDFTSVIGASNNNNSPIYNDSHPSKVEQHESLRDGSGIYLDNSTCNNGTVYLIANSDTTQTSANGYYIRYWAECSYVIKMPNTITGSNIGMKNVLSQYGINATGGGTYTVTANYYYQDNPYQEIGLTMFNDNGGSWTESLSQTNNYLTKSGKSISTLAQKIASGSSWAENATDNVVSQGLTIFTGSMNLAGTGGSINNKKLYASLTDEYSVENITYTFHMAMYKDDLLCGEITQPYVLASSSGDTGRSDSGSDTLTGSDEEYQQAATNGQTGDGYNNEYAPNNDISVSNGGSGGSSSSNNNASTTGGSGGNANIGDGAIVINNNPTFNNSSSSSSASSSNGFGSFLSTLISLIANGKTSSVETISSISGTTGYTNLVNTYLSTVPSSLWNVIIVTMTAVLGISIIGFIVGLLFKIFF